MEVLTPFLPLPVSSSLQSSCGRWGVIWTETWLNQQGVKALGYLLTKHHSQGQLIGLHALDLFGFPHLFHGFVVMVMCAHRKDLE